MDKADKNPSIPWSLPSRDERAVVLVNAKEENKVREGNRKLGEVQGSQGGPWGKVTFESKLKGGGIAGREAA